MTEKEKISYPNVDQSWGILGIMILMSCLFGPVFIFLPDFIGKELSFLLYYLLATGASFLIFHRRRKERTGFNSYNFSLSTPKIIGLVSIGVIAIQTGLVSPIVNLIPMSESIKQMFLEFSNLKGIFSFIAVVIAAPILEELIFRGIILDGLLRRYSPVKSILLSSVLFGIIHLNPWQFISAMTLGIFSGWVYYRTNKLILSIIIHSANNLFAISGIYFMDSETMPDESLTSYYGGLTNFILVTAGAIILTGFCIYFLRIEFNKIEINKWQPASQED